VLRFYKMYGLRGPGILYFRNEGPDRLKLVGQDRSPVNGVKYFRAYIEFGFEDCNIESGFIRKMLYPENIVYFEVKVSANSFAKAFRAGSFEDTFTGLGGHYDMRPEVFDLGLVE